MKAVFYLKDGDKKFADIKIPYKFIQTVIGNYDFNFKLEKFKEDICEYSEVSRQLIDFKGGNLARSSKRVSSR